MTTRLGTEEDCLRRLDALLSQTPPVAPRLPVCVGRGDRRCPEFMRPGRPLWRVLGKVVKGTEAPAGLCPDCQDRTTATWLFELVDPPAE
jgi:hypothetical protein